MATNTTAGAPKKRVRKPRGTARKRDRAPSGQATKNRTINAAGDYPPGSHEFTQLILDQAVTEYLAVPANAKKYTLSTVPFFQVLSWNESLCTWNKTPACEQAA